MWPPYEEAIRKANGGWQNIAGSDGERGLSPMRIPVISCPKFTLLKYYDTVLIECLTTWWP
jgi:hypothetical protein